MRTIYPIYLFLIIASYTAGSAYAAEDLGDLDVTIRVIDSKQTINEFINRIELPKDISETAHPPTSQTPSTTEDSAKKHRKFDDDISSQRRHKNDRDRRQNDVDRDNGNNRQSDYQNEQPATERPSSVDRVNQEDSTNIREQTSDSHDEHEDSED